MMVLTVKITLKIGALAASLTLPGRDVDSSYRTSFRAAGWVMGAPEIWSCQICGALQEKSWGCSLYQQRNAKDTGGSSWSGPKALGTQGQATSVYDPLSLVTCQTFSLQLRLTRFTQRARLDFKLDLLYFLPCHVTNWEHFTVTIEEGWHHSKELQVTEIFMQDDDWHSKDSAPLVSCCFFERRYINLQTSAQIS